MKRHALFVGVDDYADQTIQPLRCAVNDATELAGFFKHVARFDRAEALPNPRNCEVVFDRVANLLGGLGPGDEFLFFFAGHGVKTQDGHRLVCVGDRLSAVRHSWAGLPLERLKHETAGACNRLFLLDACRTDVLATNRGVAGTMETGTRDLILGSASPVGTSGGTLTILCSCDDGESAGEILSLHHGLFSMAMLDLLEEESRNGRQVLVTDEFAYTLLPDRMRILAEKANMDCRQKPQKRGPPILLLDGVSAVLRQHPPQPPVITQALVVCPVCGKKNDPKDTFRCRECGRDNLCLRHQDMVTFLCHECAQRVKEEQIAKRTARKLLLGVLNAKAGKNDPGKAAKEAKPEAVAEADSPLKPATDSATNQLFDRILGICGEARDEYGWSKLHIEGSIPAEKLENFRRTAVQRGKDVKGVLAAEPIALCDNTVFESAKNGFLLTEKGIAVSNSWPAKTPAGYVTWEEFVGPGGCVEQDDSNEYNIMLFKGKEVSIFTDVAATGRSTSFALSFFGRIRKAVGRTLAISSSAHGADSPLSFSEAVASAFNGIQCTRFWIGEAIPPEKRTNAAMAMGVGADDIMALYDDTFWGGAREGFVVTGKGFHFKNATEEAEFMPWPKVGGIFIFCEKNKLHVGKREVNCVFIHDEGQEVAKALETLASRFV